MATAASFHIDRKGCAKNLVEKLELTLYKALQRVEQKYNVPQEVWLIVENFIFRNINKKP